ncbi:MAG: hypothetical protein B7Z80_10925 [Rhodospirillales bacterium 20-64-7]|nr:MAG: hypothetical protein B7Z80_10925 [Rhodospirillales bacterium 20-64-7]HQT75949.1 PepSY domain-containing protein [Rhodopila sp.]
MKPQLIATLAVAGLFAIGSGVAQAAGSTEIQEATALQGAKVSLSQAISTAEQRTGGKAFDAGVDIRGNRVHIAVETNGPKGVQTTFVDPQNGHIVGGHAGPQQD